jgi:hypothetical protein
MSEPVLTYGFYAHLVARMWRDAFPTQAACDAAVERARAAGYVVDLTYIDECVTWPDRTTLARSVTHAPQEPIAWTPADLPRV